MLETFPLSLRTALLRGIRAISPLFLVSGLLGQSALDPTVLTVGAGWVQIHAATNGNDAAPGTSSQPVLTLTNLLARIFASNQAGWNVQARLGDGVYRAPGWLDYGTALPHDNSKSVRIEAINAGKAVLRASTPVSDWSNAGAGTWSTPWTNDWGAVDILPGYNFISVPEAYVGPLARRGEMIWVGETTYLQVLSEAELAPGRFFVDEAANRILVRTLDGNSPALLGAEMNATLPPLVAQPNSSFRNFLRIQKKANFLLGGLVFDRTGGAGNQALNLDTCTNVLIENCVFATNADQGLNVNGSARVRISNCLFLSNGGNALGAGDDDSRTEILDSALKGNGWRIAEWGGQWGWNLAALKIAARNHVILRGCTVSGNWSHGIWLDVNARSNTVTNCVIASNGGVGFFSEINQGPNWLTGNRIQANGWNADTTFGTGGAGLLVMGGVRLFVENNTFVDNLESQIVVSPGWRPVLPWHSSVYSNFLPLRAESNVIRSNALFGSLGRTLLQIQNEPTNASNYMATLNAGSNLWWNGADSNVFQFGYPNGINSNGRTFADFTNVWAADRGSLWGLTGASASFPLSWTGSNLAVGATPSVTLDVSGSPAQIELLQDGASRGVKTSPPWTWTLASLPRGVRRLVARSLVNGMTIETSTWINATNGSAPVAAWSFVETSGTNAAESTGGTTSASVSTGLLRTTNGVGFPSESAGRVDLPGGLVGSLSGTASLWFRIEQDISNRASAAVLFSGAMRPNMGINGDGHLRIVEPQGTTTGRIRVEIEGNGGDWFETTNRFDDGAWHQVTLTWQDDFSNRIYVDGRLMASQSASTQYPFVLDFDATLGHTGGTRNFPGTLRALRLYNVPLSPVEASNAWAVDLTNLFAAPPVPVAQPASALTNAAFTARIVAPYDGGWFSTNGASGPWIFFSNVATDLPIAQTVTLRAFGSNAAGRTATNVFTYTFDTTPPVITANFPDGHATNTSLVVTLHAGSDFGAWTWEQGTNYTEFSNSQNVIFDPIATNLLGRSLWFYARDAAGNRSATNQRTYWIDTNAPTVTASPSQSQSLSSPLSFTLTRGESNGLYSLNGGAFTAMTSSNQGFTFSSDTQIRFFGADRAGNVSATNQLSFLFPPAVTNLSTGLVAWWRFENGVSSVTDASAYGNTLADGQSRRTNGRTGQAALFDAGAPLVWAADSPSLDISQDLSLAAWIRTTNWASNNMAFLSKNTGAGSWELRMEGAKLTLVLKDGIVSPNFGGRSPLIAPAPELWHHVAAVRQGTNILFYLDGSLAGPSAPYNGGFLGTPITNTTSPVYVGGRGGAAPFNGRIDEARIYERALSSNEVWTLFTNLPPEIYANPATSLTTNAAFPFDLETSVSNGWFSTNGGSTWTSFSTNASLPISQSGSVSFYAIDAWGRSTATNVLTFTVGNAAVSGQLTAVESSPLPALGGTIPGTSVLFQLSLTNSGGAAAYGLSAEQSLPMPYVVGSLAGASAVDFFDGTNWGYAPSGSVDSGAKRFRATVAQIPAGGSTTLTWRAVVR